MHERSKKVPPTVAWSVWVVVVTIVAGLFLAWLSSQLLIEELVKRGTSKIYAPTLSLVYPQSGQKSITVVTIDDTDLKEYGLNWPVPLDYYQRLVDKLLKQQPKAIFLDILFLDDKPLQELKSLAAAACRATQAGVPFYLATFGTESLTSNSERFLFSERVNGQPCVIPVQSNISPDNLDQSQWAYPLRYQPHEETDQKSGNSSPNHPNSEPSSVALTLYCQIFKATCPTDSKVPLALIWGSKAATTNVQTMVQRSSPDSPLAPVCRGEWHGWEIVPGARMFVELATGAKFLPVCPYNQVLPVRALKGYGFSAQEIHDAVAGKIVMIGADLKAVGDNVFSPLHGRLPGVHVHAMALDNLISFEGVYKQNGDFDSKALYHVKSNLFIFFSIVLISSVMVFWKRYKDIKICSYKEFDVLKNFKVQKKKTRHSRYFLSRALLVFFSPILFILGFPRIYTTVLDRYKLKLKIIELTMFIALGLFILWVGYDYLDQGPLSIIEYVLFPIMAHFSHLGETIAERTGQWWQALQNDEPWLAWAHAGKEAEKQSAN